MIDAPLDYLKEQFTDKAVRGEGYIVAEVVADSISEETGQRLTTFRLHYQRFIHSEFMTHRQITKNASSSRAIPVKKMLEQVLKMPAMPIHWGINKPGMQANEELNENARNVAKIKWSQVASSVANYVKIMHEKLNLHKQVLNRLLEPFQFMNVVASATNYENFFWLRDDEDAQPEIRELARAMKKAMNESEPMLIRHGEWHVPYVHRKRDENGLLRYYDDAGNELSVEDARNLSASACAQVSYRNLDTSIEKAKSIVEKLFLQKKIHGTPAEHQATPMPKEEWLARLEMFDTLKQFEHVGDEPVYNSAINVLYSGNYCGWIQYRKMFKNEAVFGDIA